MHWFRSDNGDARLLATEALSVANSVRKAMDEHKVDWHRSYDQLRSDADKRVVDLRADANEKHLENQKRMDGLERGQDKLSSGQTRIFWAMLTGAGMLALALIEAALRMLGHG